MIDWQRPPEALARDVGGYMDRVMQVALIVAIDLAQLMAEYAQTHARWTDRTGNARQGLTGQAFIDGTAIILVLFHTMDYGIWLEIALAGNYAIIMETLFAHFQQVIDEMQYAVRAA
jgi:hypothetical protein